MLSGKLDKRVHLLTEIETEDAFGGEVQTFSEPCDSKKLWAGVEYGSGGERRVGAAQEQANLPVTVTVRNSSITAAIVPGAYALHFNGVEWDIESAAPNDGRPEFIVIIARARVGAKDPTNES